MSFYDRFVRALARGALHERDEEVGELGGRVETLRVDMAEQLKYAGHLKQRARRFATRHRELEAVSMRDAGLLVERGINPGTGERVKGQYCVLMDRKGEIVELDTRARKIFKYDPRGQSYGNFVEDFDLEIGVRYDSLLARIPRNGKTRTTRLEDVEILPHGEAYIGTFRMSRLKAALRRINDIKRAATDRVVRDARALTDRHLGGSVEPA